MNYGGTEGEARIRQLAREVLSRIPLDQVEQWLTSDEADITERG